MSKAKSSKELEQELLRMMQAQHLRIGSGFRQATNAVLTIDEILTALDRAVVKKTSPEQRAEVERKDESIHFLQIPITREELGKNIAVVSQKTREEIQQNPQLQSILNNLFEDPF